MDNAVAKKTRRPSSRQTILEAAAGLVSEVGAAHMTLDAVAARAGVSKGGLLYNFPNKNSLLTALIEESIAEEAATIAALEAGGPLSPAALIRAIFKLRCQWLCDATKDQAAQGLLAAIAEEPALLEPVRRFQREIWVKFKSMSPEPEVLWLGWLVMEGLTFVELFKLSPLSSTERDRLFERLIAEIEKQLPA